MSNQKGMAPVWIILIIVLILGGAGAAFYYYNSQQKKAEPEVQPTPTAEPTPTSPYDGWNTYKNKEVGYQLRYPIEWTIDVDTDECEEIDPTAKFIKINSPNDTYIHFGLQKKGDDFGLGCRTGIGAGEDEALEEKATTLLEAEIVPYAHVFEGKTTEYFYKMEDKEKEKCDCEAIIWFSAKYDTYGGEEMSDKDIDTVNLILASVKWLKEREETSEASKLKEAKSVAGKFLQARIKRNLSQAKPYVTDAYYNSTNSADFAGTSSPSMGKYKIKSAKYLSAADIYRVKATVYWYLQGDLADTSVWTIDLIEEDGEILVNKVNQAD